MPSIIKASIEKMAPAVSNVSLALQPAVFLEEHANDVTSNRCPSLEIDLMQKGELRIIEALL
jgi:hypothetical protein